MKEKEPTNPGGRRRGRAYSIKDLVKIFMVSPNVIKRWFKLPKDGLRYFREGRIIRVWESDMEDFRDKHMKGGGGDE